MAQPSAKWRQSGVVPYAHAQFFPRLGKRTRGPRTPKCWIVGYFVQRSREGFLTVFTTMITAFLLLLLRKKRTSCYNRKMSQRVEEQERRDGRVADANELKTHTKEQTGGAATSDMRDLDLPPPPKNHPVVPCLEDKESEEKREVRDESQRKEPPSSEVTTPGNGLINKATPLGMSVISRFKSEKCKAKRPKKTVLLSRRNEEESHDSPGAMPTDDCVKMTRKHKKNKHRVSSVGFTLSKEGKRKADVFWLTLPLIERQFYTHEFKTGDREDGWSMLFHELSGTDPELKVCPSSLDKDGNHCGSVLPCGEKHVELADSDNGSFSGNLVRIEEVSRQYIVTQSPLDNTVAIFWQMVWEQHSVGIVMLCKCVEGDADVCAHYWPTMRGDSVIAGSLVVECINSDWSECFCVSRLRLHNLEAGETFELLHFHYFAWSEFGGVPEDQHTFGEFLMVVRESGVMQPGVGPPIVHCATGTGRSGVFTLCDVALSWIKAARGVGTVDIGSLLSKLRRKRPGLVETSEELRFAYTTILNTACYGLNLGNSVNDLVRDMDNFTDSLIEEEISRLGSTWTKTSPKTNQTQLLSVHQSSLLLPDLEYLSSPGRPLDLGEFHVAPFVELAPEDRGIFLQPLPDTPVAAVEVGMVQPQLEIPAVADDKATASYLGEEMAGDSSEHTTDLPPETVSDQPTPQVTEQQEMPQQSAEEAAEMSETLTAPPENVGKEDQVESTEAAVNESAAIPSNTEQSAVGEDSASMASTVPECDPRLGEDTVIPPLNPDTRAADDQTELPQQMVVCQPDLACDSLPAGDNTALHQTSQLNRIVIAVVEASIEAATDNNDSIVTESMTQLPQFPQVVVVEDGYLPEPQCSGVEIVTETELPQPMQAEIMVVNITPMEENSPTLTQTKSGKRKKKKSWFKRLRKALFPCTRANRD